MQEKFKICYMPLSKVNWTNDTLEAARANAVAFLKSLPGVEVIGGDMREAGRDNKAKVIDYVLETMEATKDDVIMIGDRKFDIEGAHAIGIPCIAVEWGYGDRAEFEAHGADIIAATTEDVAELF